jgi:hypothetical protein
MYNDKSSYTCKIIETDSINHVTQLINNLSIQGKRVLLICDIDDTLIRPMVNIGSDKWFRYAVKNEDITVVREKLGLLYSLLKFCPVEKDTDNFVKQIALLADSGYLKFICLTSRHALFHSYTIMHLRDVGYDKVFIRPNVLNVENNLYLKTIINNTLPYVRYIDNVCSCTGSNKGEVLVDIINRAYLQKNTNINIKIDFDMIIFIDDSDINIKNVHTSLQSFLINNDILNNIECILVHYRYMEKYKQIYSMHDFISDCRKIDLLIEFVKYINDIK